MDYNCFICGKLMVNPLCDKCMYGDESWNREVELFLNFLDNNPGSTKIGISSNYFNVENLDYQKEHFLELLIRKNLIRKEGDFKLVRYYKV